VDKAEILKSITSICEEIIDSMHQEENTLLISSYPRIAGETDDRGRFLRLLADCKTQGKKAKLEAFKTYKITTCDITTKIALIIDLSYIDLDGNSSTIDFSGNTGTIGLYVTASKTPPYFHNHIGLIKNLMIDGKGKVSTRSNMSGIVFDSSINGTGVAHIDINKLNVKGFNIGIEYRNHAYLIRHNSVDIFDCNTCVSMPDKYVDYGENLIFDKCTLYNSELAVNCAFPSGEMFFNHCSFDYNAVTFNILSSVVHCNLCHIEGKNIFQLKGTGASLQIDNSRLVYMDTSNYKPFNVSPECSGVHIKDSYINGGMFNKNGKTDIIDGGGRVFIEGSYDYNNFGGFFSNFLNEASASYPFKMIDSEIFNSQPARIINILDSGNINISKDNTVFETGSYSYKINKKIVMGIDEGVNIVFKLRPNTTHISYRIRWKSDVSIPTNFIDCWHNFVYVGKQKNLITNNGKKILLSNIIDTSDRLHIGSWVSINGTWNTFIGFVPVIKPLNSNAFKLTMNLKQMRVGNIWIDKIEVYEF
jgi:hypothetical protein